MDRSPVGVYQPGVLMAVQPPLELLLAARPLVARQLLALLAVQPPLALAAGMLQGITLVGIMAMGVEVLHSPDHTGIWLRNAQDQLRTRRGRMSIDQNICPFCQFENEQSAKSCKRCGAAIDPQSKTLEIVPTNKTPTTGGVVRDSEMVRGMLVLYALNRHEPILVNPQREILLGRQGQGQEPPTVDLNAYDAVNLGVSRRHTLIRCIDGSYTVEDLDSANGTWLNEERLKPGVPHLLQSTDHLRLGNLKLLVYFNSADMPQNRAEKPSRRVVVLKSQFSAELTPAYLAETITPFCQAVGELQKLYDDILHQESQPVTIQQIKGSPLIELHVKDASAIEHFIKHRKLQPAAVQIASDGAGGIPPAETPNKETNETQLLGAKLHDEASMRWLREIQPGMADAEMTAYTQRLLPIVEQIFAGDIDIGG
jgi:pSer/pThr/pTyr-binding forkhead associated (FHA) protein